MKGTYVNALQRCLAKPKKDFLLPVLLPPHFCYLYYSHWRSLYLHSSYLHLPAHAFTTCILLLLPGTSLTIYLFTVIVVLAGKSIIDLGAQWIHGEINNPLYEELHAKDLLSFNGEYLVWGDNLAGIHHYYYYFRYSGYYNYC